MPPIDLTTRTTIAEPVAPHNTTRGIGDAIHSNDLEQVISLTDTLHPTREQLTNYLSPACLQNRPQIARYLLGKGARLEPQAVYAACYRGKSIEIFEVLVDYGWDINSPVGSLPALSFVLKDEALAKWFLEHGANPCLRPPRHKEPKSVLVPDTGFILNHAACNASIATFDLLIAHGARLAESFALNQAASKEDGLAMMAHLVQLGCDVNKFQYSLYHAFQGTPLHRAVRSGRAENVRFLLEKGADPAHNDSYKLRSALEEAAALAKSEITELLRSAGYSVNVDFRTRDGPC